MRVRHITYATASFRNSAERLVRSSATFGLETTVYSPTLPIVSTYLGHHRNIARLKRGAGYWLWKPFIILDAIRHSSPGDIIFYTDAGVEFVADPSPLIDIARRQPIVLFTHLATPMKRYTKRDCFLLLDADTPKYWGNQLTASFQLYQCTQETIEFVSQWLHACEDARVLTDMANVCGLPNYPEFVDHLT